MNGVQGREGYLVGDKNLLAGIIYFHDILSTKRCFLKEETNKQPEQRYLKSTLYTLNQPN